MIGSHPARCAAKWRNSAENSRCPIDDTNMRMSTNTTNIMRMFYLYVIRIISMNSYIGIA